MDVGFGLLLQMQMVMGCSERKSVVFLIKEHTVGRSIFSKVNPAGSYAYAIHATGRDALIRLIYSWLRTLKMLQIERGRVVLLALAES